MAKQTVNIGASVNDGSGDPARTAFNKLNLNNNEIYNYLGDGTNLNKLGTAAFKNTGTQAGNVMEVGAFGLGRNIIGDLSADEVSFKNPTDLLGYLENKGNGYNCYYSTNNGQGIGTPEGYGSIRGYHITNNNYSYSWQIFSGIDGKNHYIRSASSATAWSAWFKFLTGSNTSTDSNGFIKAASPIVQLYSDKIELNDEAQQQNIEFKKLGVGDYLIMGSTGFAQDGWYIETPKDANGNLLVAVVYEQLENGDISIKTYDYMLNKKGRIVADTEAPLDIPESRWIDLRLQELPKPEIEIPEPIAPPEFQPTGLAQAVATVMESYHDPEQ